MIPRRSNLDWYADWIGAVEEVFGRKWLEKKRRLLGTGGHVHKVVAAWDAASQWLASARQTGNGGVTLQIATLFDLGSDLHAAKGLPGFAGAFTAKRLKGEEWENDIYVAHIAALALQSGYQVSFVPVSQSEGVRTADLCLKSGGRTYFVECKKKSKYLRPADAQAPWPALEEDLSVFSSKAVDDYEIVIACIGKLSEEARPTIVSVVRSLIEKSESGEIRIPEFDAIVLVKKNPPKPPGIDGVWIPTWQNPGSATVKMTIQPDGTPKYGPLFRSCLYLLDSHRSTQILSSIRDARSQIPHELSGAIFVAVDTQGIPEGDQDLYFSTLADWLRRELERTDNARVLAVVLTGGIARVDVTADGAFHRCTRHWRVVRNPNCPSDFLVPGERKTSV